MKKQKKTNKKTRLTLSRHTLQHLTQLAPEHLAQVNGGCDNVFSSFGQDNCTEPH